MGPVVMHGVAVKEAVAMKAMREMAKAVAKEDRVVVAYAVMRPEKPVMPVRERPVMTRAMPVREEPMVWMDPDRVMVRCRMKSEKVPSPRGRWSGQREPQDRGQKASDDDPV